MTDTTIPEIPPRTSGRVLARNTLLNVLSYGSPMIVAVFAIPLLIRGMGIDRFGVLTLAWIVIGYFTLFDLGLGRALTKLVAEKIGAGKEREVPSLVWTGLLLMVVLGIAGGVAVGALSPWLVRSVLKIPESLRRETVLAFFVIAASIPVVIATTGLRGVLEAYQRFGLITSVTIPLGVFTYLGPLLALFFSHSLFTVMLVLMAGRLMAGLAYLRLCFKTAPVLRRPALDRAMTGRLLAFGGWITVTNIVGPLMISLDRFLISAILSITAVAYYATPFDMITKMLLIPTALAGVLFPAFSATMGTDRSHSARLYFRAVKYIGLILFPLTLVIITFSHEGLSLWLGEDFALRSVRVLQWLAIGVFLNGLGQVPFAMVQASGRADITAKLHLLELPFYLASVWWLTARFGIEGAAVAWVARAAVDTLALLVLANRLSSLGMKVTGKAASVFFIAFALFLCAAFLPNPVAKAGFLGIVLVLFALLVWHRVLAPDERLLARHPLQLFSALDK